MSHKYETSRTAIYLFIAASKNFFEVTNISL